MTFNNSCFHTRLNSIMIQPLRNKYLHIVVLGELSYDPRALRLSSGCLWMLSCAAMWGCLRDCCLLGICLPRILFRRSSCLVRLFRYHIIDRTTLKGEVGGRTVELHGGRFNGAIRNINEPGWAMVSGSRFPAKDG